MNTINSTTPSVEVLKPIYGPNDPRWATLEAWLLEHFDDRTGFIDELTPSERVSWYESKVLGRGLDPFHADVEYPQIPEELVEVPAWAVERIDNETESLTEIPVVAFHADIANSSDIDFSVDLGRTDKFDPDTGTLVKGAEIAQLWLGGNSFDPVGTRVVLDSPDKLRALARTLTEAADNWEHATRGN